MFFVVVVVVRANKQKLSLSWYNIIDFDCCMKIVHSLKAEMQTEKKYPLSESQNGRTLNISETNKLKWSKKEIACVLFKSANIWI